MPSNPINLKGQTFGLLNPRNFLGTDPQGGLWLCDCDCGGTTVKHAKELLRRNGLTASGYPMSCGCSQGGRDRITQ